MYLLFGVNHLNIFSYIYSEFTQPIRSFFTHREAPLAKLRREWGKQVPRARNMELIGLYEKYLPSPGKSVDLQTWQDLAMDDVFTKVDRTMGMPDRQVLYYQMRTYEGEKLLAERTRQYAIFRTDASLRERLQLLLMTLDGRGAAWVAPLLLKSPPKVPSYAWMLYLCSFFALACLVGMPFVHALLLPFVCLIVVNFVLDQVYEQEVQRHLHGSHN